MEDHRTHAETKTSAPGRWSRFLSLGPGLIWSASAVGVSQLIFATRAGALFGLAFLWVPFVSIFFKFFFTELMGRYTIATGKNVVTAFGRVELNLFFFRIPRSWTIWIFWSFFLVSVAGLAGIALAVGSALGDLVPALPPLAWSGLSLLSVGVILMAGTYRTSGWIARIFIAVIFFFIGWAVAKSPPAAGETLRGLLPGVPAGSLHELVPFLGWAGTGAIGAIWFSMWTKWSGRAAAAAGEPERIHENIRINRRDLAVNAVLTAVATAGFIIAGAMVLKPQGLVPDGEAISSMVSRIAFVNFGRNGEIVFLVCMAGAMYSIMTMHIDGLCRIASTTIGYRMADEEVRRTTYRFFLVIYVLLSALIAMLLPYPVILLQMAALVDTILLPVVAYLALYICTRFLAKEFQPGPVQRGIVRAAMVFFLVFSVAYLAVFLAWFFERFF